MWDVTHRGQMLLSACLFSGEIQVRHLRGGVDHALQTCLTTNELTWLEEDEPKKRVIDQTSGVFTRLTEVFVRDFASVSLQVIEHRLNRDLAHQQCIIHGVRDEIGNQFAFFVCKLEQDFAAVMETAS